MVDGKAGAGPVAGEDFAGIETDDVVREDEAAMGFGPRALQLGLGVEGEDVVVDEVGFAVMLVETGALAAIDDVAFEHDSGTAFVGVKAPRAVFEFRDVVNEVVAEDRSGLKAEGVDAAHVAEHPLPYVVEVIEFNDVAAARRGPVSPGPSDGDGGVESIVDFVVSDIVRGAQQDQNADGGGVDEADVVNVIVRNGVAVIGRFVRAVEVGFADADAAAAEVGHFAASDGVVATGATEINRVTAEPHEKAIAPSTRIGPKSFDCAADFDGRLRIEIAPFLKRPISAGEGEAFEGDVADGVGVGSCDVNELKCVRGGDDCGSGVFAGLGPVRDDARMAVEAPFAGLRGSGRVFDVIAGIFLAFVRKEVAGERDDVARAGNGTNLAAALRPRRVEDDFDVAFRPFGFDVAGLHSELGRMVFDGAADGVEVTGSGKTSALFSLAIDEEFVELPCAVAGGGNFGLPEFRIDGGLMPIGDARFVPVRTGC